MIAWHVWLIVPTENNLSALQPLEYYAKNIIDCVYSLFQLSLRDNPLVVRFVSDMMYSVPSLLELAARTVKLRRVNYDADDLPRRLADYLSSAHHCINPKCKGNIKSQIILGYEYVSHLLQISVTSQNTPSFQGSVLNS